jgi:hypothetical protein
MTWLVPAWACGWLSSHCVECTAPIVVSFRPTMPILAQGLVEYSAVTGFTDAVHHSSTVVQYWLRNVDPRVWPVAGIVAFVWFVHRVFSRPYSR